MLQTPPYLLDDVSLELFSRIPRCTLRNKCLKKPVIKLMQINITYALHDSFQAHRFFTNIFSQPNSSKLDIITNLIECQKHFTESPHVISQVYEEQVRTKPS